MTVVSPFESAAEYDDWFETHEGAYRAERAALERAVPDRFDRALEIGVGTGRFAAPLGISVGIDPAENPLERARNRGIESIRGIAESLPVGDETIDLAAFVTVFSFVDDLAATLAEAGRVLTDDGTLVVAVLDRSSPVGQLYQEHKDESPFYADATFLTGDEACAELEAAGFAVEQRLQTVFDDPAEISVADSNSASNDAGPDVREGHGDGLFAVIRATPSDTNR
ncbi:methyltransferase domain-containing protein [Natronorubrum sp. JWXQ-INN-674]|uniref:Methyltransferase domain-containing protein n=1 Tax=Natronorubrum halalkaliphilum TaxID=2691917 RepID=A0A6B0VU45_9EURY|nr:methyltransferase domain-containing protein [Natronorubrum halalkaliphilum]MXV64617.1 methyltransferase domain-containing protein [Natronorubrum halalkaliphilum]